MINFYVTNQQFLRNLKIILNIITRFFQVEYTIEIINLSDGIIIYPDKFDNI